MNFRDNNNNGEGFATPSFTDKLRMGASQFQESFKDVAKNFSLAKECERASRILTEFVVPPKLGDVDDIIPADILQHCRGVAILSIVKAGFIWSGRIGSGVVCARLPDGSWSGPSAIGTAGMGVGGQIGAQLTEVVMILNTDEAVRAFEQNASVQLGSNVSVAAGPVGRSGEISAAVNSGNVAAVYSYSKSKGLFAGVSFEGSAVLQRKDVNMEFYGRAAPPSQVLSGEIIPPADVSSEWEVLKLVLNEKCTRPQLPQRPTQQQSQPQQQQQQRETLYDEDDEDTEGAQPIGPIGPTTDTTKPKEPKQ